MRRFSSVLLALALLFAAALPCAFAAGGTSGAANRFNVVFVMDASGSMKWTDPDGYRFDAVKRFTDLLAERGNVLGCVVFSTGIDGGGSISPFRVDGSADKDKVLKAIRSWPDDVQNTNIGLGLEEALAQLEDYGDPDLPSVIILLSDGNTDMGKSRDANNESIAKRDAAIKAAHDRGIPIYTVRLNVDGKADDDKGDQPNEMELISSGTGGVTTEVYDAKDLDKVFQTFYELIYGTSTITIVDDVFPESGVLETPFDVPGIGVEEVNIIIQGKASQVTLAAPTGAESSVEQSEGDTSTTVKITRVIPGRWILRTEGVPGDRILVNMVYNTNLDVSVGIEADPGSYDAASDTYDCGKPISVTAVLSGGGVTAASDDQYSGYTAELIITDAYQEDPSVVPMTVSGGRFVADGLTFPDKAVRHLQVRVLGSYTERFSDTLGPVTFAERVQSGSGGTAVPTPPPPANTAPTPVEDTIDISVNIWPFKDNSRTVDLLELATDLEDDELRYRVESTTFPDSDYEVEDDMLTISHYSLSTGDFLIRATDSGGLYCNITINVKSRNIGVMALIGIGAIALVVLIIIGVLSYIASTKPFRGSITVRSECDGVARNSSPRSPRRGKCRLSLFAVDNIGLNPAKSFFQATGNKYIMFNTDRKVSWNGSETNRVRVESGVETCVFLTATPTKRLYIKFESRMKYRPGGSRRPSRPGGPTPPRSGGKRPAPRPAPRPPQAPGGW